MSAFDNLRDYVAPRLSPEAAIGVLCALIGAGLLLERVL